MKPHLFTILGAVLLLTACSDTDYKRQLEQFEEMNRTDIPLSPDSVLPLVRHYDHWWHSCNHRMRAYYMLGCAYRDQGEAPAATHYYNIPFRPIWPTLVPKACDREKPTAWPTTHSR